MDLRFHNLLSARYFSWFFKILFSLNFSLLSLYIKFFKWKYNRVPKWWQHYTKCWSNRVFSRLSGYREWSKKRFIKRATAVWKKMSCWCQRSDENAQTGSRYRKSNSNLINHWLHPKYVSFSAYTSPFPSDLAVDGQQQQKCLLSTKNRKLIHLYRRSYAGE